MYCRSGVSSGPWVCPVAPIPLFPGPFPDPRRNFHRARPAGMVAMITRGLLAARQCVGGSNDNEKRKGNLSFSVLVVSYNYRTLLMT